MTQDILELAVKHGASELSQKTPRVVYISEQQLEKVAATLQAREAAKWQARVAELEEALTNFIHESRTNDRYEVAVKALSNKSDEIAEYRKKVLVEAADYFASKPYEMFMIATIEGQLRRMAQEDNKAIIAASKEEKR